MSGKCPLCGRHGVTWTRPRILQALREFADEHGRAPYWDEWTMAAKNRPTRETVLTVFGSWPGAIKLAGLVSPPRRNSLREWSKDDVAQAVFEFVYQHKRPPKANDWMATTAEYPSKQVVKRLYGSWNTMLIELGYPVWRRSSLTVAQARARKMRAGKARNVLAVAA